MNTRQLLPLPSLTVFWKWIWLCGCAALLAFGPVAKAALPGTPVVVYSPNTTQNIQGDEPLHAAYVLTITSPNALGSLLAAVSLNVQVLSAPAGVSQAEAASHVTFSLPQLNFTGGNQSISVTVYVDVLVGASTGDFSYKLTTSGWPITVQDNGTFINMHADPPSNLQPPVVDITSPDEGHTYTYIAGGAPVAVPVHTTGVATQSAPVLTLVAKLSGVDASGAAIPAASIPLTLTDLGTPSADGVATLSITTPGTYTITSTATNSVGSADDVVHFVVVKQVPPPPVIVFTQAPDPTYTVLKGSTLNLPFAIRTSSTGVNIATQSVTNNGQAVTLASNTANGTALVATANGTLSIPTATVGTTTYALHAHGTDNINQVADTDTTFQVTVVSPSISVAINPEVAGNSPYTLPSSGALSIPFTFTGDVTLGSMGVTVDTISGVLGGAIANTPVTITSTTGLGTSSHATGSGVLSITTAGTYTLTATDTNTATGISATTSVTFVVQPAYIPPPPPVIVFTQTPNSTYTVMQGDSLNVSFAIRTSSTAVNIYSQSVTLDGQTVALTSNTANSTAIVATGGGTLAVPTLDLGATTYTLHAYGLDVLGQPCDTITTFTVNVIAPVITIAINPQVAGNSPYTLPASGSLSIPFTFTGDITAGATVDTITGALGNTAVTITSSTGLTTSSHATASGTLTITSPGTYMLSATDTNARSGISATTSVTFVVKAASAAVTIDGTLFFDVNYNGVRNTNEYGMAGVTVKLLDRWGRTLATDVSDTVGEYDFVSPGPGTYTVWAASVSGYSFTTAYYRVITVGSSNVTVPDIGYGLSMCDIQKMCATGCTIGYWKNNLSKCLSGSKNGMQCTPDQLSKYTKCVGYSGCKTYHSISMQQACNYMGSNSSDACSLLIKQLAASEYNYACGAYINGNKTLTYDFIFFCENVLSNSDNYSSTYITWVKDWCDAYNNSEGGRCSGPSPKGSDQDWNKSCIKSSYYSGHDCYGYSNGGYGCGGYSYGYGGYGWDSSDSNDYGYGSDCDNNSGWGYSNDSHDYGYDDRGRNNGGHSGGGRH
ncbi:MAG TPA: SdrD B-like domain-containing protein [Opitutus sp.]|nr:SdrD B-like domain-containing protein [Opitutus sp.]